MEKEEQQERQEERVENNHNNNSNYKILLPISSSLVRLQVRLEPDG